MGYIYIITNDINSKVYIGQTISTIEHRWGEHKAKAYYVAGDSRNDTAFYKAIRKYGIDHFQAKELEYVEDNSMLSDRECYWIAEYNSYQKGYNSTIGGEGRQWYSYQDFKNLWDKGYSVDEIAKEYECERNTVYYALSGFKGWAEEAKQRQKEKAIKAMQFSRKICIDCYDLKGNFLNTYESSRAAAHALNMTESMVSTALSTGGRALEYLFVKHGEPAPKPYQRVGAVGVNQYDLEGNFIATYESYQEAALALGKPRTASSSISAVCNGKRKTAYGYKWERRNDNVGNS